MEKKQWVVLRMETKSREFQSRTLLAYHLIKKGYGVILTRDYGEKAGRFPRGIYVINNIFNTNNHLLKKIKKNNNEIIVLDEEGLVYVSEEQYLKRVPKRNLELISKFLCFGQEQYKIVTETHPEYKDKVIVTGNPRINLLNDMFDKIDEDKVDEIKRNHSRYILVVSNFTMVNLFGSGINQEDRYDRIYKKYQKLGFIKNEKDLEQFNQSFNHIKSIFESFLVMVETLAEEFPDYEIIIRPHPSEDAEIWRNVAKNHSNIKVIFEGGLTEWIKGSELVIENSCTSAIESLFLNNNVLSYRPFINHKFDQPLPNKLSINVTNLDDIISITSKIYDDKDNDIIRKEYVNFKKLSETNISNTHSDESVQKIIDIIESERMRKVFYSPKVYVWKKLLSSLNLSESMTLLKRSIGITLHFTLKQLRLTNTKVFRYLDEKVKLIKYNKKYIQNKMQSIDVDEIEEIFVKYNSIYHDDFKFDIKQLDNESFIIE